MTAPVALPSAVCTDWPGRERHAGCAFTSRHWQRLCMNGRPRPRQSCSIGHAQGAQRGQGVPPAGAPGHPSVLWAAGNSVRGLAGATSWGQCLGAQVACGSQAPAQPRPEVVSQRPSRFRSLWVVLRLPGPAQTWTLPQCCMKLQLMQGATACHNCLCAQSNQAPAEVCELRKVGAANWLQCTAGADLCYPIAVQGAACSGAAVHSRHIFSGRGHPCRAPPDLCGRGGRDHQPQVGRDLGI